MARPRPSGRTDRRLHLIGQNPVRIGENACRSAKLMAHGSTTEMGSARKATRLGGVEPTPMRNSWRSRRDNRQVLRCVQHFAGQSDHATSQGKEGHGQPKGVRLRNRSNSEGKTPRTSLGWNKPGNHGCKARRGRAVLRSNRLRTVHLRMTDRHRRILDVPDTSS